MKIKEIIYGNSNNFFVKYLDFILLSTYVVLLSTFLFGTFTHNLDIINTLGNLIKNKTYVYLFYGILISGFGIMLVRIFKNRPLRKTRIALAIFIFYFYTKMRSYILP